MTTTFAVIYRWRLAPGSEEAFVAAWRLVTDHLRETCGGLGSRLHRCDDGTWAAYAQWPARRDWERAEVTGETALAASATMAQAVVERFEPVLLSPVADMLSPTAVDD